MPGSGATVDQLLSTARDPQNEGYQDAVHTLAQHFRDMPLVELQRLKNDGHIVVCAEAALLKIRKHQNLVRLDRRDGGEGHDLVAEATIHTAYQAFAGFHMSLLNTRFTVIGLYAAVAAFLIAGATQDDKTAETMASIAKDKLAIHQTPTTQVLRRLNLQAADAKP
ncbi:hypothetical protein D9Q98_004114 [Chlorella vulgaris]|uniref:Uncharacterized protein n=1 Tax=Chlorella vulgaris TaxID=3077 RepID=A0A9D4YY32_CHLVU|nr:hypothetical protein D9Q98_004114 [Chlorella vulgaris]